MKSSIVSQCRSEKYHTVYIPYSHPHVLHSWSARAKQQNNQAHVINPRNDIIVMTKKVSVQFEVPCSVYCNEGHNSPLSVCKRFCFIRICKVNFVCLFDILLYDPFNIYGPVGILPSFLSHLPNNIYPT